MPVYQIASEKRYDTDFKSPTSISQFTANMVILFAFPAVGGMLMMDWLRGEEDDEEFATKALRNTVGYSLNGLIGFREFAGLVQGYAGYEGPAGARIFSQLGRLAKQLEQGDADEELLKASLNSAGILFHGPGTQVDKTIRATNRLLEGRTDNPLELLFGPPRKK